MSQRALTTQKGKSGQKSTCQNPPPEWKIINPKPFEVKPIQSFVMKTSGDLNPEMIFKGFKVGGSLLEKTSPTGPATKSVDGDREATKSVREIEMRRAPTVDKNSYKIFEKKSQLGQTQERRPLSKIFNCHSASEGNTSCSMEIETLEIPKSLLKRIDPSL